ncbi:MAG: hypothetical protein WBA68_00670 [Alteraurantiacibacter sp.]
MAKRKQPPIPIKLYKHFAIATLVMTATIAMFADSDQREAVAEAGNAYMEQAEANREQLASISIGGPRPAEAQGSFGSDEGGSYGAPMSTPKSAGSRGGRPGSSTPTNARRVSVAGYDQAWIDALSEEQYRHFLEAIDESQITRGGGSGWENSQSAIEAASARRAGRQGRGADAPS